MAITIVLSPAFVLAWTVSPTRIQIADKPASFHVSNPSDNPLTVQVDLVEWKQDSYGVDAYTPTEDIIFFPKILTLEPHQKKVIRLAPKPRTSSIVERTYRVYVSELAPPALEGTTGVQLLRAYGVPIFIAPRIASPQVVISASVDKGDVTVTVKNTGNVADMAEMVSVAASDTAGETFFTQVSGWWVLPGSTLTKVLKIPADACRKSSKIEVRVKTSSDVKPKIRAVPVYAEMCGV